MKTPRKPKTLYFTCTEDLQRQIQAAAEVDGLSVASWLRRTCTRAIAEGTRTRCACGTLLGRGARFYPDCGAPSTGE